MIESYRDVRMIAVLGEPFCLVFFVRDKLCWLMMKGLIFNLMEVVVLIQGIKKYAESLCFLALCT